MGMRRTIIISALTVAASAMGGGVALASPAGAPSSSTPVTFDCRPAGVFTGFANSGDSRALTWNPFFLTADGSTELLVPTANDIVVTAGTQILFAPDATKAAAPGSTTCTLSGGSGPVHIGGTVSGNLVPR